MQSYNTSFTVSQTPQQVYNAINNVPGWWGPIEGNSQHEGDEFIYRYKDMHFSKHQVVELVPDKKIVWLTSDSQLNFVQQKDEWNGTRIIFEISQQEGSTVLTFTQEGLHPDFECYSECSNAWNFYVNESLKKSIMLS